MSKGKKQKRRKQQSAAVAAVKPPRLGLTVVVCYVLALLLYVGGCTISIISDGLRVQNGAVVQQNLTLADFEQIGLVQLDNDGKGRQTTISTDDDPKLVYRNDEGFYATRLVFAAQPNKPAGEIVLYYATELAEDGAPVYTEGQKLWARQDKDGSWFFDLNGQKLVALRLDPGTKGGILWTIDKIVLNAPRTVLSYYVPSAQPVVLLLLLPPLAAAGITQARMLWRGRPTLKQPQARKTTKKEAKS